MALYRVVIEETREKSFDVEARNIDEAESLAEGMNQDGDRPVEEDIQAEVVDAYPLGEEEVS